MIGEDLEDFVSQGFPSLGLFSNNAFLISNIGELQLSDEEVSSGWKISHAEFSVAATRASVGNSGIVFNVASVNGGSLVINLSYEQGVLKPQTVRKLVDKVAKRLNVLIT
ncbi:hypothetical protein V1525DRAFT_418010 [Lipomyces kononenkoae]|uniref:Uncharacterized protein n=1 Tax=Lipomyces kononenkoae TaxID=34357 RepID=A0ACC3T632_LIPKO